MSLLDSLRLLAATGCGLQIGAFLLLSLFYRPLLYRWPEDDSLAPLFQRFYRMNTLIAIISGILAIFAEQRQTGFILAILGMSYILLLSQLMPAFKNTMINSDSLADTSRRRSPAQTRQLLKYLQNSAHVLQIIVLFYIIFRLFMT